MADALARWSTKEAPGRVHVALDSVPDPQLRDWIAAFPGVGTEASWEGRTPAPSAVTVEPVADPRRPSKVWVAASSGAKVALSDQLGGIDSTTAQHFGAVFLLPHLEGAVRANVDGSVATGGVRDSLSLKAVLVVGMASWEGKFIAAALEEQGWRVDARFAVAPTGDVRQGPKEIRIDTARYAFVVAIDSVMKRYGGQLSRYVRRQGGGLIVAGEASLIPALSSLLPARWGVPSRPGDFEDVHVGEPRRPLALGALYDLKAGAIALERREEKVAIAGWRVGRGRVIQIGYLETWRWRMAGSGEESVADHRLWWSALASGVAYAPRFTRRVAEEVEPTPLASLIRRIGDPTPRDLELAGILDHPRLLPILFTLLIAALFVEWLSRRSRGEA